MPRYAIVDHLLRRTRTAAPRRYSARRAFALLGLAVGFATCLGGCSRRWAVLDEKARADYSYLAVDEYVATETATPDHVAQVPPPHTVAPSDIEPQYWDVSLDETVQIALQNSEVLRDLGGTVLRAPDILVTRWRSYRAYTDPRFGVEGALSAFDANFLANLNFENNDRAINNSFFGGGTNLFTQDLNTYNLELNKTAANGARFAARSITNYDANNAPANRFGSAFDQSLETEIRQPLLAGAGTAFNRIAGPNATPGVTNGVLVARVNTEISETEFEYALRDYVSNVENAYWDLYFSYRDLEAKKAARDSAYRVWQKIEANRRAGRRGAEIDKAQAALEQYYRFQEEVENALSGKLFERTQNRNGTNGGALRGIGGVQVAERRLRLLIGIPINAYALMRPLDEPPVQEIAFDWDGLTLEAMNRRVELKQQKLRVRRREMDLFASKNFLKPQLDAVGRYRWRGFGKDLLDQHSDAVFAANNIPPNTGADDLRFKDAVGSLFDGDFQEWQVGVELTMPLGFRLGHTAVQNAELNLARERSLLYEQERQIVHDLSNSLGEVRRAHTALRTNYNRRAVARQLVTTLETLLEEDRQVDFDRVLDAQRRLSDASSAYYLSLAEYAISLKNVDYERGSLLDEHNLLLADRVFAAGIEAESQPLAPIPIDVVPGTVTEPGPAVPAPAPAAVPMNATTETGNDIGVSRVRTVAATQPSTGTGDREFFARHALAVNPADGPPHGAVQPAVDLDWADAPAPDAVDTDSSIDTPHLWPGIAADADAE